MSILDIIILLPILGAVAVLLGAPTRSATIGVGVINLAFALIALLRFDLGKKAEFQFTAAREIVSSPKISYAVGIDGLGLVMLLLTVIVSLSAFWVAPRNSGHNKLYSISLLLISAGALGAFCSTDVFFIYAFHELALIPTFLMIGLLGTGERIANAWRITIYLAIGSIILLAGFVAMQLAGGGSSFALEAFREGAKQISPGAQKWIYLLLLVGFGTLVSLFPLHSWAAPAYASAPAPVTMLHAGVLKKFGLYGLLRFTPMLPAGFEAWRDLLIILLLGNILFIGFVTIAQHDLDDMLGNSSVMHMGYIFLGIAANNAIGYTGAVILMFAHGVAIALLFALCGGLRERGDLMSLDGSGGLAKGAPAFGFLFGLAAFASIGLPGFANFAGELMVFFGGFHGFTPAASKLSMLQIATVLAIWGVVISAVYMLRAFRAVFLGPNDRKQEVGDIPMLERLPFILLAAALLAVGCYPKLLTQYIPLPF